MQTDSVETVLTNSVHDVSMIWPTIVSYTGLVTAEASLVMSARYLPSFCPPIVLPTIFGEHDE